MVVLSRRRVRVRNVRLVCITIARLRASRLQRSHQISGDHEMKNSMVIALTLLFAAGLFAQSKSAAKTRFTSVYTNFTTNCKTIDGENGSDGASFCRGPGGYEIENYFAAAAALYVASYKGENTPYAFPMLD